MPRGRLKHDCEQQREIDRAELDKKEAEEWQKAPIAPKEVEEACFYLYSEYYPHNEGYFCDWDEFFESWAENLPEQIGCISKRDFDILGIPFDNPEGGFQRKGCLCVAGKTELLNNKKRCPSGCLYCYWRD